MSKKYTFVLEGLNIHSIDKKYNINLRSNINDLGCNMNKTNIDDLEYGYNKVYSYLDEAKKTKKCLISMHNTVGKRLPNKCSLCCHWCRHEFSSTPIGCPLKKNKKVYIVDGIYCSFNCVLAFIDSTSNYIYNDSYRLLSVMYNDLFNTNIDTVLKAPSWKLLTNYGGNKSIEEFRSDFNKIEYNDINNFLIELPVQHPIGWLYEEKINF